MTDIVDRPKGSSLKPLRALWPYIKPYKITLTLALIALLVAAAALLVLPMAVQEVIDRGFVG